MTVVNLLKKYYPPSGTSFPILFRHSTLVAKKAAGIAGSLAQKEDIDIAFVEEAALLHDIGILHTDTPDLGCRGALPYLCHGLKGREILEGEGLPRHGLVCERHIGIGLSAVDIRSRNLPLPQRDMLPITLEEQIVTYADLFFSKNPAKIGRERTPDEVRTGLARFGADKVEVFDGWHGRFGGP